MKRRKWKKILRSRGTMWVLLGCLTAGAVTGTVYKNNRSLSGMEQAAGTDKADSFDMGSDVQKVNGTGNADNSVKMEDEKPVVGSAAGEMNLAAGEKNDVSGGSMNENTAGADNTGENHAEKAGDKNDAEKAVSEEKAGTSIPGEAAPASALLQAKSLEFLRNDTISWPVQGEVLTDFNMEETVYHPTLNLYRCSPAMIIQSEYGTPVSAPADGMVVSVGNDEQIGNYIVMDLGSSYQITMGQLMDIHVSEGDLVKEGDLIAYIARPTACYSVEGDNLYLAMTADETPVDPLDYLVY